MASRFLETIEIIPRPERALLCFEAALAVASVAALGFSQLPEMARIAGVICVAASTGYDSYSRVRGARCVARAVLLADGSWQLFTHDAGPVRARTVRAWGLSLGPVMGIEWECSDERRRQAWVLERDIGAGLYRRLRVRLRLS